MVRSVLPWGSQSLVVGQFDFRVALNVPSKSAPASPTSCHIPSIASLDAPTVPVHMALKAGEFAWRE